MCSTETTKKQHGLSLGVLYRVPSSLRPSPDAANAAPLMPALAVKRNNQMDAENWHTLFNPQKFLSRVNLDELIGRNKNKIHDENKTHGERHQ